MDTQSTHVMGLKIAVFHFHFKNIWPQAKAAQPQMAIGDNGISYYFLTINKAYSYYHIAESSLVNNHHPAITHQYNIIRLTARSIVKNCLFYILRYEISPNST